MLISRPSQLRNFAFHGCFGAFVGLLILFPASSFVQKYFGEKPFEGSLFELFRPEGNWAIVVFYIGLGIVLGIGIGFYENRALKLFAEIERLSITDDLTGAFNRRLLMERLKSEIERSDRYDRPLSLVMVDLDDFKKFNDTQGHLKGDMLLKEFVAQLKENIRKADWMARYGGEEFTVVLPETNQQAAVELSERLRKAIADHSFFLSDEKVKNRITASFGVAEYPEDAKGIETLLNAADKALYQAKAQGKNKVCVPE